MYNFFQVSLKKNIPIIEQNYLFLKYKYKTFLLTIICKKKEINNFKHLLKYPEIKIINEEFFVKKVFFKKIFLKECNDKNFKKKIKERINWYYQQIIKLSYIFYFFEKKIGSKLILWDADTLMIKKINFFNAKRSVNFATYFEFNKKYFETLTFFFKKMPIYFLSATCQFNAISKDDFNNLYKIFSRKKINYYLILIKIIRKISQAIFQKHKDFHISLFSEQDFLSINNLNHHYKIQKPVLYFRSSHLGILSQYQIFFLKIFNFKHVTYDNYDYAIKKNLSYLKFFYYLFKFLSIFIYNYFVHQIFFILNIKKNF